MYIGRSGEEDSAHQDDVSDVSGEVYTVEGKVVVDLKIGRFKIKTSMIAMPKDPKTRLRLGRLEQNPKNFWGLLDRKPLSKPLKHGLDQVLSNKILKTSGACSVANPKTPKTPLILDRLEQNPKIFKGLLGKNPKPLRYNLESGRLEQILKTSDFY
jgi:hypothetical protein